MEADAMFHKRLASIVGQSLQVNWILLNYKYGLRIFEVECVLSNFWKSDLIRSFRQGTENGNEFMHKQELIDAQLKQLDFLVRQLCIMLIHYISSVNLFIIYV